MTRSDPSNAPSPNSQLEREMERERDEHLLNQDAKARLGPDEDERLKDARRTAFSSNMRR